MDRKYNLKLDLQFRCNNSLMKFDEFDKDTSDFFIEVTRGGKVIDISNALVTLVAIKPSEKVEAQFIEVQNNSIYGNLRPSMKDEVGKYQCIASISLNGETVNIGIDNPLVYEVTENKLLRQLNQEVISEERFAILTDMINRLNSIELSEAGRVEAENSRVEAEKLRKEAIEKIKTDIEKLITDTKKEISDYKNAKDTAIDNDLKQFKEATNQAIDNYKSAKDTEINNSLNEYKTNTTNDIEEFKNTKSRELDDFKNTKNSEIDNYKREKDLAINKYVEDKNLEIDEYVRDKNKEIDAYKTSKDKEIDLYKENKDTLINNKIEEVEAAKQNIISNANNKISELEQAKNNMQNDVNSKLEEADNRITELQNFETQLEQIETDINHLKNNGTGGGNANIDDTVISKSSTWSSDKIVEHGIEQDGVFWIEKEDNFISASDTYEYKLKEIEVFGDTWQDSDGKNLVLFDASLFDESDSNKIIVEKEGSIQFTNSNAIDTKEIQLSPNTTYTIHAIQTNISGDSPFALIRVYENNVQIGASKGSSNYTQFTTSDTGVIKIRFFTKSGAWINEVTKCSDLMIFKGTDEIKYETYHKADLSNIQHVGELYVDEEGQPILDSEGREQYKIEIEVCNANLWDVSKMKIPENWDGVWKTNLNTSNFNLRYGETYYFDVGTRVFFKKNSSKVLEIATNTKQFATIPDYDEVSFDAYIPDMTLEQYKEKLKNGYITTGNKALPVVIPHKSHKQTILLPCQLMKVGDVKDRLFWDESKGRYIVEKKVFKRNLLNSEWVLQTTTSISDKQITIYRTQIENSSTTIRNDRINLLSNSKVADWNTILKSVTPNTFALLNNNQLRVQFEGSVEECKLWANDKTIYYELGSYELIETNITTPITITTYNNKTHVYVVNSNNAKATIKAKFPIKTASAVANLNIESAKNSKDINELQDSNVDLIGANFEIDFRLSEVEWTLEDAGLATPVTALKNIKLGGNTMALTRFEQAKILILAGEYDKERMTYQLTRYLERGYIKQSEYDELLALMEAKELVTGK